MANRAASMTLVVLSIGVCSLARAETKIADKPRGFSFHFSPDAPPESLLPTPPRFVAKVVLVDELADVPEVALEAELPHKTSTNKAIDHVAHNIAKIHHLSKTKPDGYMHTLLGKRPELAGLPFVLGDACRQSEERRRQFSPAVHEVRFYLQKNVEVTVADADQAPRRAAEEFWSQFGPQAPARTPETDLSARIAVLTHACGPQTDVMRRGLVKYLAIWPNAEATRALAKLAVFSAEDSVRHPAIEALKTRREKDYTDLLRHALRYPLPAVAQRAADAIVKLERTDMVPELITLLEEPDPRAPQLREIDKQPSPVVREVVKINYARNCLLCHAPGPLLLTSELPALPVNTRAIGIRAKNISAPAKVFDDGVESLRGARVDVLSTKIGADKTETTQPLLKDVMVLHASGTLITVAMSPNDALRVAVAREVGTLSVVVRELAKRVEAKAEAALPNHVVTAPVAVPGLPIPFLEVPGRSDRRGDSRAETPELFVRLDVTYLRPDFAVMLPVTDADPWPKLQRFDFVVRTRQLSEQDAAKLRETIRKAGPSPYQQIAHAALRRLTGRDAEPTAEAWRRMLSRKP